MTPETLFTICNTAVLPFWVLLAVAPRWKWTQRAIPLCLIPLAAVYLWLAATNFFGGEGDFGSLDGVATLFQNPEALLAGWIHYLVFDLFVGAWEIRDAQRQGISHWFVLPCLALTLMAGPVGLLLYFAIRAAAKRAWTFEEVQNIVTENCQYDSQ